MTITDDDVVGIMVSAIAMQVREGSSARYTVRLATEPTEEPVELTIGVVAGDDGGDVYTIPSVVSFTQDSWDQPQSVTVFVRDDTDVLEENGVAALSHTAAGGDYAGVTGPGVDLTLMDDELANVVISHTTLNVVEGERATYTVTLTQAPNAGETVTVTVAAPAGVNVAPQSVSLSASNWNTGGRLRRFQARTTWTRPARPRHWGIP